MYFSNILIIQLCYNFKFYISNCLSFLNVLQTQINWELFHWRNRQICMGRWGFRYSLDYLTWNSPRTPWDLGVTFHDLRRTLTTFYQVEECHRWRTSGRNVDRISQISVYFQDIQNPVVFHKNIWIISCMRYLDIYLFYIFNTFLIYNRSWLYMIYQLFIIWWPHFV